MKLIIDIPKDMYEYAQRGYLCGSPIIVDAIRNGNCNDKAIKGSWSKNVYADGGYNFTCSSCECVYCDDTNFCPNCGADMRNKEAHNE